MWTSPVPERNVRCNCTLVECPHGAHKYIDTHPRLAVDRSRQWLSGTFELALNHLLDQAIDLSHFDARCKNDETGAPATRPRCSSCSCRSRMRRESSAADRSPGRAKSTCRSSRWATISRAALHHHREVREHAGRCSIVVAAASSLAACRSNSARVPLHCFDALRGSLTTSIANISRPISPGASHTASTAAKTRAISRIFGTTSA